MPDRAPAGRRDNAFAFIAAQPLLTFAVATLLWSTLCWSLAARVQVADDAVSSGRMAAAQARSSAAFSRVLAGIGTVGPTVTAVTLLNALGGEEGTTQRDALYASALLTSNTTDTRAGAKRAGTTC